MLNHSALTLIHAISRMSKSGFERHAQSALFHNAGGARCMEDGAAASTPGAKRILQSPEALIAKDHG